MLEDRAGGVTEEVPADALFILIGAEARTEWLEGTVERDTAGYILTGADLIGEGPPSGGRPLERPARLMETSVPGVFAAGDVRHGSVKRVASAVGEGSIAIRSVHEYLGEQVPAHAAQGVRKGARRVRADARS
jgi:thioredoxin reductase (NADPH)